MKRRIYVVGAGGKTTLIDCLAHYFKERGKRVLILTTTHRMLPEKDAVLIWEKEEEKKTKMTEKNKNENKSLFCVSCSEDAIMVLKEKMEQAKRCGKGVSLEFGQVVREKTGDLRMGCPEKAVFHAACEMAEIILVEADGSRRLPVKVPAEHEPVIFDDADLIFVVQGLSAVGKEWKDVCHRLKLAEKLLAENMLAEKALMNNMRIDKTEKMERTKKIEEIERWEKIEETGEIEKINEMQRTEEIEKINKMERMGEIEKIKEIERTAEKQEKLVRLEQIGILIKWGYLEPLRVRFPRAEVIPVLNQADSEEMVCCGQRLLENLGERKGIVGSLRKEGQMLLAASFESMKNICSK